jgi:hypothetical protein
MMKCSQVHKLMSKDCRRSKWPVHSQHMTVEQFLSLKNNFAAPGNWDHVREDVFVSGVDYMGVQIPGGMFIGIEKDGHTHS